MPVSETMTSARTSDINGFIEIKGNPISKVGVFDYSGAQLGLTGEAATRIFKVYRPADELANPDCLASFRLLPFVDEHAMLGAEDVGGLPAERKGVQGFIGEQVEFDPPYLRANIKIVSEAMKSLINAGKIELSPGYRCRYEFTPGVFDGVQYDAIQRDIRGNHLALVEEGRTGPDVAVLDHLKFTIDAKEFAAMADENTPTGGEASADRIKALLEELKPLLQEQQNLRAMLKEMGIELDAEEEPEVEAVIDEEPKPEPEVEVAVDEEMKSALDAALERIKDLEGRPTMDSVISSIADRDALASKVSAFVGTFDSARMTTAQVAQYGVKKLGIPCQDGAEVVALTAWMHGRVPDSKRATTAMDGKSVDILSTWGAK